MYSNEHDMFLAEVHLRRLAAEDTVERRRRRYGMDNHTHVHKHTISQPHQRTGGGGSPPPNGSLPSRLQSLSPSLLSSSSRGVPRARLDRPVEFRDVSTSSCKQKTQTSDPAKSVQRSSPETDDARSSRRGMSEGMWTGARTNPYPSVSSPPTSSPSLRSHLLSSTRPLHSSVIEFALSLRNSPSSLNRLNRTDSSRSSSCEDSVAVSPGSKKSPLASSSKKRLHLEDRSRFESDLLYRGVSAVNLHHMLSMRAPNRTPRGALRARKDLRPCTTDCKSPTLYEIIATRTSLDRPRWH